ncbi:MAG: ABC transporter substrate-binding protein [Ignavibacteriae bacterium HGW-Ignavibacteriae-2]|jgi:multiple sugar transport system substrate-binding protein|nr:MAG: ABC transporter substrate-binding protein [Ignavibacteriae bacterium HGW-Ignavibacteriae-2]
MKRSYYYKNIILLIILAVILIALNSCGNKNERKGDSLIYWSSNNTQEIEFANYITEGWNKNNPQQKVTFQPVPEGQSSEEIILAAVVGNTTPDIYSNMWQGDVEAYAESGVLVALDTLAGFLDFISTRCDSSVITEITSEDGHIYQIPWKINPIMLMYNINSLKDIGVNKVPSNYGEFFSASAKYQKDTDGDGYIDRWFGYSEVLVTWWQRFFDFYPLYLAASNGANLVKNNKAVFNNEYAVQVFKFLREMYEKKYFPMERLSARQDPFLTEVISTRFTGPWEIIHAEKYKPKGLEYSFAPMPVPNNHVGPVYTYGDPKNIVIFNTCPNPQSAWEFIKYMIEEKNDLKLLEMTMQLPRRKHIEINPIFQEFFKSNPKMKIFAEQGNYVRGTDTAPVLKEVFDLISQEYEACVIYGIKTPEEAVAAAAEAVDLLFIDKAK